MRLGTKKKKKFYYYKYRLLPPTGVVDYVYFAVFVLIFLYLSIFLHMYRTYIAYSEVGVQPFRKDRRRLVCGPYLVCHST